MKRKDALAAIKFAAYHEDQRSGLRIYTENRLSFSAYKEAWDAGLQQKKNGMKCSCFHCEKTRLLDAAAASI